MKNDLYPELLYDGNYHSRYINLVMIAQLHDLIRYLPRDIIIDISTVILYYDECFVKKKNSYVFNRNSFTFLE